MELTASCTRNDAVYDYMNCVVWRRIQGDLGWICVLTVYECVVW